MNAQAHVARLLAEVAAGPAGPLVGAYFDLDGTLVSGFTATVHAGHRIRNRQARVGEVLGVIEASIRYRLGRMEFERLVERAGGYLRGESLAELDEFLTGRLARYKHPKAVEHVEVLPRNPAGKVLKTELRARFGTEAPIDASESSSPPTVSAGRAED